MLVFVTIGAIGGAASWIIVLGPCIALLGRIRLGPVGSRLDVALVFCKCKPREPLHHLPGRERRARDRLLHRPRLDPERRDVRPQRVLLRDRRSEERRGGQEGVSTCSSRWSPSQETTKTINQP